MQLVSMGLSELSIDALQPDLYVGSTGARVGARVGGTASYVSVQLLQPHLHHTRKLAGKVESSPRPIPKIQSQELTREDLQSTTR